MKLHSIIPFIAGIVLGTAIILFLQNNPTTTARYRTVTLAGSTFDMDVKVLVTEDIDYAVKYVRENLDSTVTAKDFDARAVSFPIVDGKSPIIWMATTEDKGVIAH